jgi:hypothetical protein
MSFHVDFSFYLAMGAVENVSDSDISWHKPPNENLQDTLGLGLPPPEYNLAGMSGGPVTALFESPSGIASWALAGIIYECQASWEIVKAVRADRIGADGIIR